MLDDPIFTLQATEAHRIELFNSNSTTGNDIEGQQLLWSGVLSPNASGDIVIDVAALQPQFPSGVTIDWVSATATRVSTNDTSEPTHAIRAGRLFVSQYDFTELI